MSEMLFLASITIEMIAKMVAYGVVGHKEAYLRDPWCQIDVVLVALTWAPIFDPEFCNFSGIRAIRSLRPLRTLKRLPGLVVVVQSILAVVPRLANVVLLAGFISLIFAVLGVELFKGALHNRCALPGFNASNQPFHLLTIDEQADYDSEISCNPSLTGQCPEGTTCTYFASNPGNNLVSFDSIFYSMLEVLQLITFNDWTRAMYLLMRVQSPYVTIYFVLCVVIFGLFVCNLFLAVIFEEFTAAQRMAELETKERMAELETKDEGEEHSPENGSTEANEAALLPTITAPAQARRPVNDWCLPPLRPGCRKSITTVVSSQAFDAISSTVVVLNMVLMCMPYYGMSIEYAVALDRGAIIFNRIYIVEMALKLYGLGCRGYWGDGWNALDGTIVLTSVVELVLFATVDGFAVFASGGSFTLSFLPLRSIRLFRVLRVLRLMRTWKNLNKIIMGFGKGLSRMSYLFLLVLIFMLIFALMGMQLFGGVFVQANGFEELPRMHFDFFEPAIITVFILMMGDWLEAMTLAVEATSASACLYYLAVMLVGRYVLINLVIAVVLSSFGEEDSGPVPEDKDIPTFYDRNVHRDHFRLASKGARKTPSEAVYEAAHEDEDDGAVPIAGRSASFLQATCARIVVSSSFQNFILVAIILSSACLALDSPRLDEDSSLSHTLISMDLYLWPWLFLCELLLKVGAFGFAGKKGAYIHDGWNQLDFVIVIGWFAALAAVRFTLHLKKPPA